MALPNAKRLAGGFTVHYMVPRIKELAWRMWIGKWLLRLAAWIMWVKIEIEEA